jgi:hypothetical protein
MKRTSGWSSTGMLLAAIALRSSAATAQSYGPVDQVLTVGAAEFRPDSEGLDYIGADGYLTVDIPAGFVEHPTVFDFRAPLRLPEGALVEKVCLWAMDSNPDDEVDVVLVAVKLVPGGESPRETQIGPFVVSDTDLAYRRYCQGFSETLRGHRDIDGDGTLDAVAYFLKAKLRSSGIGSLGVGAVQVTWRRQTSEAPAAPSFGDVPPTDGAFASIEALAASGITAGCAGGNFCPDAKLTRRQMAAFLARALGLHWSE